MDSIIQFCTTKKDFITILLTAFAGLITLSTFIKAIIEYQLQGRQKRAELFDKLKTLSRTDAKISTITSLIESQSVELSNVDILDRYYYLGFYEQISIAVNSGLIKKDVAHYMFGYYALRCWEDDNFWLGINRNSYYWSTFKKFVELMQVLEDRNVNKTFFTICLDAVTRRNNFKY